MKKVLFVVVLSVTLVACNNSKEKKAVKTGKIVENKLKDSVQEKEIEEEAIFKNDFDVLIPRTYRTYENENPVNSLTQNWIDLYKENGEYYLGKADFTIEKSFDECSGDSTKIINSKKKSLIFMNDSELKLGKIKSLKITKDKIWPKESLNLTFNNTEYVLRGEGRVLSSYKTTTDDGKDDVFKGVKDYKLFLTGENGVEKLILEQENFNDTFVKLLFAGDIDSDGKLDFIFSANRDYEEERVILFLSSKAENGNSVKKVSEIAVQFDC